MALTFQHKMDIISPNASEKVCEDKGTAVRVFHFGSSIIEGNISSLILVRGTQTYQSGERMTGSHEVSGSIPLISTKDPLCRNAERIFFVFDGQKCCQRGIPVWRMGIRRPLHVETGRLLTNRPPV